MREWLARLIDWFRRDTLDRELTEELHFHREQLEHEVIASGGATQDAPHVARRRLGNVTRTKEEARERWSIPSLDTLQQDVHYALRGLRRSPGFTATIVLTLSLGIGANAAMFSAIDGLMFRPLGLLRDPSTVHRVYLQWEDFGRSVKAASAMPYTRYLDIRKWTTSFSELAAFDERSIAIGVGDAARERRVESVSASFFDFFDAKPVLGRFFTAAEDVTPRGADVVVLSHAFWQAEFGGRNVIGELLQVGNIRATIIGVAPKDLTGVNDARPAAVFQPITTYGASLGGADGQTYFSAYRLLLAQVLVRRKPGVSIEQASTDVSQAHYRSWEVQRAVATAPSPTATAARARAVVGAVRVGGGPDPDLETRTMVWVSGVAAIMLLIACANVANLFLGRALRRQRETAMRVALGVSRGRLLIQSLTESLVLALIAAAFGLVVAHWGGVALRDLLVTGDNDRVEMRTDWRTLGLTLVVTLAIGVVTGIAPALFTGRGDLVSTLRAGARGGVSQPNRLRAALLVVQGALSVTLLIGATLFVRSLDAVKAMRMGYDADRVLIVNRVLRGTPLDDSARVALRRSLISSAQAIPGVEYATWVQGVPLSGTAVLRFSVPGVDSIERLGSFTFQATTPDYFRVMDTHILRGRGLSPDDRIGSPRVAVMSEGAAKALWPGKDGVGECIRTGPPTAPCTTVVGIAEDMVQRTIATEKRYHLYFPLEQFPAVSGTGMLLRLRGDPGEEAERVRKALQRDMPGASYVTVQPMRELVDGARQSWRLGATMFVGFGVLALVVAAVGLYGVIGYNVAQRMHELAVRVALGARHADILRLVVGQSVRFALGGVALGVALALSAGRWLQPLLYKQSASDPVVYAAVGALVLVVAFAASASPAARAARADPNEALRAE